MSLLMSPAEAEENDLGPGEGPAEVAGLTRLGDPLSEMLLGLAGDVGLLPDADVAALRSRRKNRPVERAVAADRTSRVYRSGWGS